VTSIGDSAFESCSNLKAVYYTGTYTRWIKLTVGTDNSSLTLATVYFYSESKPTNGGNYWHYVDDVPRIWHEHIYTSVITGPTCTKKGYITFTCACGDTYKNDFIEALGHTAVIDKYISPTCTKTGLTEGIHCSVCNDILVPQVEIPMLAHIYDDKYDKTCNECGFVRNV
jgi:hypothetical protein